MLIHAIKAVLNFRKVRILKRFWTPWGCYLWILFDFHYLYSRPLERGPLPSINNWHFITYPSHWCRLWCGLRFFLSATATNYILISGQIGALSKGFLVGQSTLGHLILLECGQILVHNLPVSYLVHPIKASLIWVKYSQRITKLFKNDIIWSSGRGSVQGGGHVAKGGFHKNKLWAQDKLASLSVRFRVLAENESRRWSHP